MNSKTSDKKETAKKIIQDGSNKRLYYNFVSYYKINSSFKNTMSLIENNNSHD